MKNITIIVPLHVFDEERLTKAINSISVKDDAQTYTLMFVGPKPICTKAEKLAKKCGVVCNITVVENDDTDVATQINKGVFSCVTKYFTVLEFDDEFTEIYFNVMQRYAEERPDLSIILPVEEFYNNEGKFVSFGNEIGLDATFCDENIGEITLNGLKTFMDFNCTGALIKTEDFISLGSLKKSLKIAMWYEFLMRLVYNEKKAYVIPKIGYKHTIDRPGCYYEMAKKEIIPEEGRFLIDTANQEYFFKEDRNKVFTPGENKEEQPE